MASDPTSRLFLARSFLARSFPARSFPAPGGRRGFILVAIVLAVLVELAYAGFGEKILAHQVPPASLTTATGYYVGYCGDHKCRAPETALSCAVDCRPRCGDGICSPQEDCPRDCTISETCGDLVCDPWEDEAVCPADCAAGCGDGECKDGEKCGSCPTDCCGGPSEPECGDGLCSAPTETMDNCEADCGKPASDPIPPPPPPPVCGDGACELGEGPCSCASDCGPPAPGTNCLCGNGVCNQSAGETCSTCAGDCGSCMPPSTGVCGNAVCEEAKHETCLNCSLDCGTCPAFEDPEGPEPPSNPAEQWDGLDPSYQEHFRMNVSADSFTTPVTGSSTLVVETPLITPEGKRNVVLRDTANGQTTTMNTVASSWNFWGGGVRSPNGKTLVCWNRFTGADSGATHGNMPDPRTGVTLVCRVHDGVAWGPEMTAGGPLPAAWIAELKADAQGRPVVVYQRDSFGTLFNSGKPGDGLYEVTFQ